MNIFFRQSRWHVLKLKSHDKLCTIPKKYLLTLKTTQEILVTEGNKPDMPFVNVTIKRIAESCSSDK